MPAPAPVRPVRRPHQKVHHLRHRGASKLPGPGSLEQPLLSRLSLVEIAMSPEPQPKDGRVTGRLPLIAHDDPSEGQKDGRIPLPVDENEKDVGRAGEAVVTRHLDGRSAHGRIGRGEGLAQYPTPLATGLDPLTPGHHKQRDADRKGGDLKQWHRHPEWGRRSRRVAVSRA